MPRKIPVLRGASEPGYKADDLTVTLDAGAMATAVAKASAEAHREAILSGKKASGGPQRPLSPEQLARASKGKRSRYRGVGNEGLFPASIEFKDGRGDRRAESTVAGDQFFDEWLEAEAARGVEYFFIDGDAEDVIDDVIEQELRRQGFTD